MIWRSFFASGMLVTSGLLAFFSAGCSEPANRIDSSLIHIPAPGERSDNSPQPKMSWDRDSVNLGLLAEGRSFEHTFSLTNTGDAPLIITQVNTSCACTAAKGWPTTPILPGGGASIFITLETRGKRGAFIETATVVTNARGEAPVLVLTGEVLGPDR